MDMHDYENYLVEQREIREENSLDGWIYIGVDIRFDNIAKIGLTTGRLGTRASGSQNPFYALLCAFKIREGVNNRRISKIESSAISFLNQYYNRIYHYTSGEPSEWFYANPFEMKNDIYNFLCDNYFMDMYAYYCDQRNMDVIKSWENPKLLAKKSRPKYKALDLSDPPVDSNCYMPGGCGENCDCWG